MKKKPFFKKWWFWLILIIAIGAAGSDDTTDINTQQVQTGLYAVAEEKQIVTEPVKSEVTTEPEKVVEPPVESPVISEPIKEEPKQEDPKQEEPIKEEPAKVEPVKEEPVKENTPPVVPKEEKPKEVKPAGTDYIGNKNTKKFHYTWCNSVKQMKESNKYYYTGTREEMIAKGYKSCGNCHP